MSLQTLTLDGVTSFKLLKTLKTHEKRASQSKHAEREILTYVKDVRILKESEVSVHNFLYL